MKLSELITRLKGEITPKEWELLELKDSTIKISEHNRNTLLEMRNTQITEDKEVSNDTISDLELELKAYLDKYMAEDKNDHKWIIISSLFLTYIKKKPMHPIDKLNIKVVKEDNRKIYYCPFKKGEGEGSCKYCVCHTIERHL